MTPEHLVTILKQAHAKADKEGWECLPEGSLLTLHISHDGASLTVQRVSAVKGEGEILWARTPKRDVYAIVRSDLFAIALEGGAEGARRPGFG
jgi:hypothetical protein